MQKRDTYDMKTCNARVWSEPCPELNRMCG